MQKNHSTFYLILSNLNSFPSHHNKALIKYIFQSFISKLIYFICLLLIIFSIHKLFHQKNYYFLYQRYELNFYSLLHLNSLVLLCGLFKVLVNIFQILYQNLEIINIIYLMFYKGMLILLKQRLYTFLENFYS
jgi:hypothetical protein